MLCCRPRAPATAEEKRVAAAQALHAGRCKRIATKTCSPTATVHTILKGTPHPFIFKALIDYCNGRGGDVDIRTLEFVMRLPQVEATERPHLEALHVVMNGGEPNRQVLENGVIALETVQAKISGVLPTARNMLAKELADTPNHHLVETIALLEKHEATDDRVEYEDGIEWPRLSLLLFNQNRNLSRAQRGEITRLGPSYDAIKAGEPEAIRTFLGELRERRAHDQGLLARTQGKMEGVVRQAVIEMGKLEKRVKGEMAPIPVEVIDVIDAVDAFSDGIWTPDKKARLETTLGKAGDELRVYIMGTNEGFDDEWAPIDSNLGSLVGATDRVEVLQVKKCSSLIVKALETHRGAVAKVVLNARSFFGRMLKRAPLPLRLTYAELAKFILNSKQSARDRAQMAQYLDELVDPLEGYLGHRIERRDFGSVIRMLRGEGAIDQALIRRLRLQLGQHIEELQVDSLFSAADAWKEEMIGPDGQLHKFVADLTHNVVGNFTKGAHPKLVELKLSISQTIRELTHKKFNQQKLKQRAALCETYRGMIETIAPADKRRELDATLETLFELFNGLAQEEGPRAKKTLEGRREGVVSLLNDSERVLDQMIVGEQGAIAKVIHRLGQSGIQVVREIAAPFGFGELLPPAADDGEITIIDDATQSWMELLMDRPFKWGKARAIEMFEVLPSRAAIEDQDHVTEICAEAKEKLEKMKVFSFSEVYQLFQSFAQHHIVIHGIELPASELDKEVSEEIRELKKICVELQNRALYRKAVPKFRTWVEKVDSRKALARVLSLVEDGPSSTALLDMAGQAITQLHESIETKAGIRSAAQNLQIKLGGDCLSDRVKEADKARFLGDHARLQSPDERLESSRENFLRVAPLILTCGFASFVSGELRTSVADVCHAKPSVVVEEAAPTQLSEMVTKVKHQAAIWMGEIAPADQAALDHLSHSLNRRAGGFAKMVVLHASPIVFRLSRYFVRLLVPLIESATQAVADNITSEDTAVLGSAQGWASMFTQATIEAKGVECAEGFLAARTQIVKQKQNRPQIMRNLIWLGTRKGVPAFDLAQTVTELDASLKAWHDDPREERNLISTIFVVGLRAILATVWVLLSGFTLALHEVIIGATRIVLHVTGVVDWATKTAFSQIAANITHIDKMLTFASSQLEERVRLVGHEEVPTEELVQKRRRLGEKAKLQMEGFIHAFLRMLKATQVTDRHAPFDPDDLNFTHLPIPDLSWFKDLRNLALRYGASVITDIWTLSGRDPKSMSQLMQEMIYSSVGAMAKPNAISKAYRGKPHPVVRGYEKTIQAALERLYEVGAKRLQDSLGREKRALLNAHIGWIRGELIPSDHFGYCLPTELSKIVEKVGSDPLAIQFEMLEHVSSFEETYDRNYQALYPEMGSIAQLEMRRIRTKLDRVLTLLSERLQAQIAQLSVDYEMAQGVFATKIPDELPEQILDFIRATFDSPHDSEEDYLVLVKRIDEEVSAVQKLTLLPSRHEVSSMAQSLQAKLLSTLAVQKQMVTSTLSLNKARYVVAEIKHAQISSVFDQRGTRGYDKSKERMIRVIRENSSDQFAEEFERRFEREEAKALEEMLRTYEETTNKQFEEAQVAFDDSLTKLPGESEEIREAADKASRVSFDDDLHTYVERLERVAKEVVSDNIRWTKLNLIEESGIVLATRGQLASISQEFATGVVERLVSDTTVLESAFYASLNYVGKHDSSLLERVVYAPSDFTRWASVKLKF